MEYMKLDADRREEFLRSLADMPHFLKRAFEGLSVELTRSPGPDGAPSPVEQVWHLADLEREGFGERIRRLLNEVEPELPDFKGAEIAAARNYRARSLDEGLAAFVEARGRNIAALGAVDPESWLRRGTQEGVGPVSLCDIPAFMSRHDSAHRREIEAWQRSLSA
jgi:hypothetical protein